VAVRSDAKIMFDLSSDTESAKTIKALWEVLDSLSARLRTGGLRSQHAASDVQALQKQISILESKVNGLHNDLAAPPKLHIKVKGMLTLGVCDILAGQVVQNGVSAVTTTTAATRTAAANAAVTTTAAANAAATTTAAANAAATTTAASAATITAAATLAPTATAPVTSEGAKLALSDTIFFIIITVTMPYTMADLNADVQLKYTAAVASAAGTISDNVDIVSTKASRRAGSVEVETKVFIIWHGSCHTHDGQPASSRRDTRSKATVL